MGKYLKSIKKVIKAMEQNIIKLRCTKNKKDILSSASEPVFLRQLVELFKLDRKELMRKLQSKKRGEG